MSKLPTLLFVSYGGGHINALLPVAQALHLKGLAHVEVLGLTTAAQAVRAAGLPLLQFRDFLRPTDARARVWGERLAAGLPPGAAVDPDETLAYLGLSYADMEAALGEAGARDSYAQHGRHNFLPVRTLERILRDRAPDLVVITNAPRAERAAGIAAAELGIPALCLNVLFAIDEIAWLRDPAFCDRVCVLNDAVRGFFERNGRPAADLRVTGNPAFDALWSAESARAGGALRASLGAGVREVVLWASQPELVSHPTVPGKTGDPAFPGHIAAALLRWANARPGRHVLVRPHPSEPRPQAVGAAATVCGPEHPIAAVLHACDAVVTMTSTVAVEANVLGRPVVQVLGSLFDHSSPFAEMGIAHAGSLDNLATMLDQAIDSGAPGAARTAGPDATGKMVQAILELLNRR